MSSNRPPRIAVTGVGGGSGQGILKALIESPIQMEIFAVDITRLSAGLYWPGVTGTMLPRPEDDITSWKSWLLFNKIDLLIPGADRDLPSFAAVADEWRKAHICRVAISSPEMVALADDKAMTQTFLENFGIGHIPSFWGEPWYHRPYGVLPNRPIVIKDRHGMASRGLVITSDEDEIDRVFTEGKIAQEYIEGDEYTCALFFNIDHKPVAKFTLKRWLRGGDTYRAEVVNNPKLNAFLDLVGEKLSPMKPFGPINVQLRERDGQFYILEFNARCSGTTPVRAHFGYNEPEMLVRHICQREDIVQPETRSGFMFRLWGEMYLEGMSEAQILGEKE